MVRRLFLLLIITTAFATTSRLAGAHGGHEHLMGIIAALSGQSITVKTGDDHLVKVTVNASTKYERDGKPALLTDVKVGQRAVVHASVN